MSRIVNSLVRYAFYLALTGGLVDATLEMARMAAHAHTPGLLKLSQLNHQLVGRGAGAD
jgi:hypothetical protein